MIVAQSNAEKSVSLVEIMSENSTFPCFKGGGMKKINWRIESKIFLRIKYKREGKFSCKNGKSYLQE